jgi:hypothetical protein
MLAKLAEELASKVLAQSVRSLVFVKSKNHWISN